MSSTQRSSLEALLQPGRLVLSEFHHGLCIGADEEAHEIVRWLSPKTWIIGHPGDNPDKQVQLDVDSMYPVRPNLVRNHIMVDLCGLLIAAPLTDDEVLRSGTWSTVRYARSLNLEVVHLYRGPMT
jgi:hypothetical protein